MTRDELSQVCEAHYPLLQDICDRFSRWFGADPEDVLSDAHLPFIHACETYQPERGPLEKRIKTVVRQRLIDAARKRRSKRAMPTGNYDFGDSDVPEPESRAFDLETYLLEVSEDAAAVVRYYLQADRRGHSDRVHKVFHWSVKRFRKALREIRETLTK